MKRIFTLLLATIFCLGITAQASQDSNLEELILHSQSILQPYIEILGNDTSDGSVAIPQELIDNLSSVELMGKIGTISHGFSQDVSTIDIMDWISNEPVSKDEFRVFIYLLNQFFDCEASSHDYAGYSEETYQWIDSKDACIVYGWLSDARINLRWYFNEELVAAAEASTPVANSTSSSEPSPTSTAIPTPTPTSTPTLTTTPTTNDTESLESIEKAEEDTFVSAQALTNFIDINIAALSDDDLVALLKEVTDLATSIRTEQNDRDYQRALAVLGDSSVDPVLKSYEGIYQLYSAEGKPHFEDYAFVVIKDGMLYSYNFLSEELGKASVHERTLASYDAPGIGILYCDKDEITQYTIGETKYVYSGGIKLDVMEDGQKCLQEYKLFSLSQEWSRTYDTYYYLPVSNITKEELDTRVSESVNKPDPVIGMTSEEVLKSRWGKPTRINTTATVGGIEEQWVYDKMFVSGYIYLTNGVVTGIQY